MVDKKYRFLKNSAGKNSDILLLALEDTFID